MDRGEKGVKVGGGWYGYGYGQGGEGTRWRRGRKMKGREMGRK